MVGLSHRCLQSLGKLTASDGCSCSLYVDITSLTLGVTEQPYFLLSPYSSMISVGLGISVDRIKRFQSIY